MTNYKDFKTDDDGNWVIENGNLVIISGDEEIQQRARNNLKTNLTAWSFDESQGVDYQNIIFEKSSNQAERMEEIRRVLLETEGISSIISMVEKKGNDKLLEYEISVRTDNQGIIGLTA